VEGVIVSATEIETPVGIDIERLHAFVGALRAGDFAARLPVDEDAPWRVQDIAVGLNRHIEQMGLICAEFKRVADELGTQGKFGPQAEVWLDGGPWKQMLEAVNEMAANLTRQVRDFNRTAGLIAKGDLTRPVTVPCEGETLELKNRINSIIEQLKTDPAK
jgi:osomolarity two-component system sensor histidine kinase NIK1